MSLGMILLLLLVLFFFGALPVWEYSRQWSYAPAGLMGAILLIVIILMLMRVI